MDNSNAPTRSLVRIHGAIATPMVAHPSDRTFTGAIYDASGALCRESQRTLRGSNEWSPCDLPRIETRFPKRKVPGRSLYLGHYTGHYGHFLLETLSRLWAIVEEASQGRTYDRFVFHPFLHDTPAPHRFSPARTIFGCFGIQPTQFHLVQECTEFEDMTVPSALFEINYAVDSGMGDIYRSIVKDCLKQSSSALGLWARLAGWGEGQELKLYLSRRRARGYHPMANEREIERVFSSAGFRILHPQKWRFEQQVALFQRASVIAGVEGSALHNSVFMRPGRYVINIGTPREPEGDILNQRLCDALSGVQSLHIPFRGEITKGARARYDVAFLRQSLERLSLQYGAT